MRARVAERGSAEGAAHVCRAVAAHTDAANCGLGFITLGVVAHEEKVDPRADAVERSRSSVGRAAAARSTRGPRPLGRGRAIAPRSLACGSVVARGRTSLARASIGPPPRDGEIAYVRAGSAGSAWCAASHPQRARRARRPFTAGRRSWRSRRGTRSRSASQPILRRTPSRCGSQSRALRCEPRRGRSRRADETP